MNAMNAREKMKKWNTTQRGNKFRRTDHIPRLYIKFYSTGGYSAIEELKAKIQDMIDRINND